MTDSSWKSLADAWIGIAPRDGHYESWMRLNLHPELEGHAPEPILKQLSGDPRSLAFARKCLRQHLAWDSVAIDWMPQGVFSRLLLATPEKARRTATLAGGICCLHLLPGTILKNDLKSLEKALGVSTLQHLRNRSSLARLPKPASIQPFQWDSSPESTLAHTGILCLRLALLTQPHPLESRLAALLPSPAWNGPLRDTADADKAMVCLEAISQLELAA